MREIKVRAWDTKREKMWSADEMGQDQLTISPDGKGFVNVSGIDTRLSQYANHLIPLQFTGLKDKNNKEIYEGDILLNDYYGKSQIIVKWITDGFNVNLLSKGGAKKCEIIGNIYQNSELIQQSTKEGMK